MKKLITLLFLLVSFVTYSQSGVGYLNYTVYNIISNGAGQYANNSANFVNMFDVTKGASVYASGVTTAAKALYFVNSWTSSGVPNGGAYTGIKITGYFVPKESGTYSFGIDGDDGVDFSLDGTVVASFYGPHGFGGYRFGTINLVAGKTYTFMARYQNWGGGWGLDLAWKRPSQSQWTVQSNEVYSTKPSEPTKKAVANFNLNTNLNATTFSIGSSSLSSVGSVDITTSLDSNKVANGNYKMTLTPGQVEWVWAKALPFDRYGYSPVSIGVDLRKFNGIDPSKITSVKFLDGYDGDMTYKNSDSYWANYDVLSPNNLGVIFGTETNGYVGTSQYLSSIRNMGGGYQWGVNVDPALTPIISYKTQSVSLTTTNNLTTLYNSIVTVTDVYLAFKELANGGLFGNQTGNEFAYGIQYKNADVNDDGIFNEADCFLLLQNLTGSKALVDGFSLDKTMRIIPQATYDSIGKSNWTTFTTPLGSSYSFDINTGKATDTFNYAVAWKGDVNLSHSTTPKSNGITTMSTSMVKSMSVSNEINASIITEIFGDSIYAYITLDPLSQNVVGTQFQLNYDNSVLRYNSVKFTTKGSPTNYASDKGSYINLGSLISDGSTNLDNTTTYKISFTSLVKLDNIFGLISIGSTDAVNKNGVTLKVRIN
jgi:hypothetical protein